MLFGFPILLLQSGAINCYHFTLLSLVISEDQLDMTVQGLARLLQVRKEKAIEIRNYLLAINVIESTPKNKSKNKSHSILSFNTNYRSWKFDIESLKKLKTLDERFEELEPFYLSIEDILTKKESKMTFLDIEEKFTTLQSDEKSIDQVVDYLNTLTELTANDERDLPYNESLTSIHIKQSRALERSRDVILTWNKLFKDKCSKILLSTGEYGLTQEIQQEFRNLVLNYPQHFASCDENKINRVLNYRFKNYE